MQFRGPHGVPRHTRGVIGALALPEPGDASVLPHERTAAKAKSDRLALLRATRANLDPIWGLSLAAGLTDLARARHRPCRLRRRRRRDPRTRRHRRPGTHGADPGTDRFDDGRARRRAPPLRDCLRLPRRATRHRRDGRGRGRDHDVRRRVGRRRTRHRTHPPSRRSAGRHRATGRARRRVRHHRRRQLLGRSDRRVPGPDGRRAWARHRRPGRTGNRGSSPRRAQHGRWPTNIPRSLRPTRRWSRRWSCRGSRAATWRYWHDAGVVAAQVDKGAASAAILCSPVSVAQTRSAATDGARMPQKTTFFAPKPLSGMVFRTF